MVGFMKGLGCGCCGGCELCPDDTSYLSQFDNDFSVFEPGWFSWNDYQFPPLTLNPSWEWPTTDQRLRFIRSQKTNGDAHVRNGIYLMSANCWSKLTKNARVKTCGFTTGVTISKLNRQRLPHFDIFSGLTLIGYNQHAGVSFTQRVPTLVSFGRTDRCGIYFHAEISQTGLQSSPTGRYVLRYVWNDSIAYNNTNMPPAYSTSIMATFARVPQDGDVLRVEVTDITATAASSSMHIVCKINASTAIESDFTIPFPLAAWCESYAGPIAQANIVGIGSILAPYPLMQPVEMDDYHFDSE